MDTCDRCGKGVALRATHPTLGTLLMCGHHGEAHRGALEAAGWTITVLTERESILA